MRFAVSSYRTELYGIFPAAAFDLVHLIDLLWSCGSAAAIVWELFRRDGCDMCVRDRKNK